MQKSKALKKLHNSRQWAFLFDEQKVAAEEKVVAELQVKLMIKKRKHEMEWLEKADEEDADDNELLASRNKMDADVVCKDAYATDEVNMEEDEDWKTEDESCQKCPSTLSGSLSLVEELADIRLES